jgi:hypothetical protein
VIFVVAAVVIFIVVVVMVTVTVTVSFWFENGVVIYPRDVATTNEGKSLFSFETADEPGAFTFPPILYIICWP